MLATQPSPQAPVSPRTLTDQVYQYLKSRILDSQIAPGSRIVVQQVASELRVSLTPVRESLRLLNKDGLVEMSPHRGAVATALTLDDFSDLREVRASLEQLTTRLACANLSDVDLVTLEDTCAVGCAYLAGQAEKNDWFEADERFHVAIMQACGNAFLQEIVTGILDRVRLHRRLYFSIPEQTRASIDQHKAVIMALRKRDAATASEMMFIHLTTSLSPERQRKDKGVGSQFDGACECDGIMPSAVAHDWRTRDV